MWSALLFYLFLNLGAFIIHQSNILPMSRELYFSPTDLASQFSLSVFLAAATGAGFMGIAALITRQYVYAAGALLIWVVGMLIPILQWIVGGLPIVLAALLPAELTYISSVVNAVFIVLLFMFMVEITSQRQIT